MYLKLYEIDDHRVIKFNTLTEKITIEEKDDCHNLYNYDYIKVGKMLNELFNSESKILSVFINLTDICNLSCSYCFNKDNNYHYRNTNNLQFDIYNFSRFIENASGDICNVVYTGGEPLLELENILNIHRVILNRFEIVNATVITNGVLLNKINIKKLHLMGWHMNMIR